MEAVTPLLLDDALSAAEVLEVLAGPPLVEDADEALIDAAAELPAAVVGPAVPPLELRPWLDVVSDEELEEVLAPAAVAPVMG